MLIYSLSLDSCGRFGCILYAVSIYLTLTHVLSQTTSTATPYAYSHARVLSRAFYGRSYAHIVSQCWLSSFTYITEQTNEAYADFVSVFVHTPIMPYLYAYAIEEYCMYTTSGAVRQ